MSAPPTARTSPSREQHFYVAISKFIFAREGDSIAWSRDPVRLSDAARIRLRPLILYGVAVPGTPIHWLTYAAADRPRSLAGVLNEAWSKASGLRGYPDRLTINRHVAAAAPGLVERLGKLRIEVAIAGPSDKRLSASLRAAQNAVLEIQFHVRKQLSAGTLDWLNAESAKLHAFHIRLGWRGGLATRDAADRAEAWMALPLRETPAMNAAKLDWTPGPWLSAWEASLPPSTPLTLKERDGMTWVTTHRENALSELPDPDEGPWAVRILVNAWPNDAPRIASAVGLTARELQWYLSGGASIPPDAEARLRFLLGLEYDSFAGDYRPEGPCVLIAHSARAATEAYEALSHGGDLEYSFEPVPERGAADPSWRYLLFQPCGGMPSVMMLPRGSRTAERLERFINFSGEGSVTPRMYRDLVSTCARACADPLANRPEMIEFVTRQGEYLERWRREI